MSEISKHEQFSIDIMEEYKRYGEETRKTNKMLVMGFVSVVMAFILALSGLTVYFTQEMKQKDIAHSAALDKQRKEFIDYLALYDFSGNTDLTGIYNIIDSEGNVIASDLPPDIIQEIMGELANGKVEENTSTEDQEQ